jgi:flagellar biosynthesis/type III secretory pathway M-ring protein FliF/YscJ
MTMTYTERQNRKTTAWAIAAMLAVVVFVAAATMLPVAIQDNARRAQAAKLAALQAEAEAEAEATTAATMRAVREYLSHAHHRAGVCPDWHIKPQAVAGMLGNNN